MNFTDYLAFIQVSIAFNFASAFWKKENDDDAIEKLFRVVYDKEKLRRGFEKNQELMSSFDEYRPAVADKPHEEIDEKAFSLFYEMKEKWTGKTQNILYFYKSVTNS